MRSLRIREVVSLYYNQLYERKIEYLLANDTDIGLNPSTPVKVKDIINGENSANYYNN